MNLRKLIYEFEIRTVCEDIIINLNFLNIDSDYVQNSIDRKHAFGTCCHRLNFQSLNTRAFGVDNLILSNSARLTFK